jgi:hypothetical protein
MASGNEPKEKGKQPKPTLEESAASGALKIPRGKFAVSNYVIDLVRAYKADPSTVKPITNLGADVQRKIVTLLYSAPIFSNPENKSYLSVLDISAATGLTIDYVFEILIDNNVPLRR